MTISVSRGSFLLETPAKAVARERRRSEVSGFWVAIPGRGMYPAW